MGLTDEVDVRLKDLLGRRFGQLDKSSYGSNQVGGFVTGGIDGAAYGEGHHVRRIGRANKAAQHIRVGMGRIEPGRFVLDRQNDGHPIVDGFHHSVRTDRDDAAAENLFTCW